MDSFDWTLDQVRKQDGSYKQLQADYGTLAMRYNELLEDRNKLADKYAAAQGRIAFLEEQIKQIRGAVSKVRWVLGET